ncbi:MAG TPA: hypothetical protein VMR16_00320 [Candidatus Saccharimonadales bacterium]|nr:hypothetical protein [Candidatus Saccharimonadales bacterium]
MSISEFIKVKCLGKASRVSKHGPRYISLVLAATFFAALLPIAAHAETYISQSYATNDDLALDSIVSLQKDSNNQVEAANNNNVDNLLGVVVNPSNSILSVSSDQKNTVEVATSGVLQVLVSDINGTISNGDQITASPIDGVGMKATSNVRVIGISQDNLDNTNSSQETYTAKDGSKKSVMIGQIPVQVSVSYFFKEPDKTIVPSAIQNLADAVADKTVSTLPIIVSMAIFIVTIIVVVSIIYAMVRSSIISVGRNPMSQSAIYRDIIQLSALVLAILAVGMISIFLVLTRM